MKSCSSPPMTIELQGARLSPPTADQQMNRRPCAIAVPINYALRSRIVLQQGHALGRKIKRLTARCCRCEHARTTVRLGATEECLREGPMKRHGGYTGIGNWLWFPCRQWLGPIRRMAIAILLLVLPINASTGNAAAGSDTHVYLLRGVLNVFSLGLDQ